MKTRRQLTLPPMRTLEEAQARGEAEHDSFYVAAFQLRRWLEHLLEQALEEYAGDNPRRCRVMQTGQAQRAFLQMFGHITGARFADLLESLYRFTEYDDALAGLLFRALEALAREQECSGDFTQARAPNPGQRPRQAVALWRHSVERWCDWLDAVMHLQVHARWRLATEPSPRALPAQEHWPCEEVDQMVIALWPLVLRHNWTFGDLLSVLRDLLRQPAAPPCRSEPELAAYCAAALGLHKLGRGESTRDNRPAGYEVALRLCPPLRPPSAPGEPPWL